MNDTDIINIVNSYKYFRFNTIYKKLSEEEKNYIINRYKDTSSYKENIIRIYNHIEERPKCPICGNYCNLTNKNIYGKTCGSKYCHSKLISNEIKETCLEKYGVQCILNIPSAKEKFKKTWGLHSNEQTKNIANKRKTTSIIKYGVDNKAKLEETKEKMKQTNLEKYNHICSAQGNDQKIKSKITCQNIYGCDYASQSDIVKAKQIETKRKNNSFNNSKPEEYSYVLLKEKYSDVIRQYKDNRYPFLCDFYIPSLDLFIECQYSWTHNYHPYNDNDKNDQLYVEQIKLKNSKYYNNMLYTWTIRDVNKRNIAKQNNLNYIEFWNINELKEWLNQDN